MNRNYAADFSRRITVWFLCYNNRFGAFQFLTLNTDVQSCVQDHLVRLLSGFANHIRHNGGRIYHSIIGVQDNCAAFWQAGWVLRNLFQNSGTVSDDLSVQSQRPQGNLRLMRFFINEIRNHNGFIFLFVAFAVAWFDTKIGDNIL